MKNQKRLQEKFKISQVDSCESLKEGVAGVKEAECNGENENGVSQGALQGHDSSSDSSHQNGSDKPDQEESSAPSTPRKKRGRRKLEHPEKRESPVFHSIFYQFRFVIFPDQVIETKTE